MGGREKKLGLQASEKSTPGGKVTEAIETAKAAKEDIKGTANQ